MKKQNVKYYLAGAVSLITLAAYLPSLQNGFVEWDDSAYVFENPYIRSFDPAFFRWAFFDFYAANWHPLTWISHAVDYAIWGLNPLGHHLTNNILHAVNTFIVVLVVVKLLETTTSARLPSYFRRGLKGGNWNEVLIPNKPPLPLLNQGGELYGRSTFLDERGIWITAGVTGLLFGLHPVHVESVAWVAERKDLLCALFFLLSVMTYMGYVCRGGPMWPPKEGQPHRVAPTQNDPGQAGIITLPTPSYLKRGWRSRGRYLLCLFFFILALLSKPMAVSLPLVLLILDWYPYGRIGSLKSFIAAFTEKLPFIAFGICSSVLTILAQKAGEAMEALKFVPLPSRLLVGVKSLIAYLWKMILPLNLVPFYPYPGDVSVMSLSYFFPIILATGITITFLTISRKHKFWLAVWCYYVLTLLPVLGIIQVGGQAMADRYTYLPSLGPFLIAGAITSAVYEKVTPFKRWISILRTGGIVAAIAVAGSLSYLTIQQIGIWKDGLSLWDYVIEKEPLQVPHAYNNRGAILLGKGLISEATEHFQIAIKLEPGYADAYNNLCLAFKSKGLYGKAIEQCRTAIGLKPDYAEAHNNLGVAYKAEGLVDKAMEQYRIALSLRPDYADALFNLGIVCLDRGDLETARWAFEAGLKLRPDDYKARQVFNRIISR